MATPRNPLTLLRNLFQSATKPAEAPTQVIESEKDDTTSTVIDNTTICAEVRRSATSVFPGSSVTFADQPTHSIALVSNFCGNLVKFSTLQDFLKPNPKFSVLEAAIEFHRLAVTFVVAEAYAITTDVTHKPRLQSRSRKRGHTKSSHKDNEDDVDSIQKQIERKCTRADKPTQTMLASVSQFCTRLLGPDTPFHVSTEIEQRPNLYAITCKGYSSLPVNRLATVVDAFRFHIDDVLVDFSSKSFTVLVTDYSQVEPPFEWHLETDGQ